MEYSKILGIFQILGILGILGIFNKKIMGKSFRKKISDFLKNLQPIVVHNSILPTLIKVNGKSMSGFMAFPFIFIVDCDKHLVEYKKKHVINHEYIHFQQALETGIVGFYGLFLLELLIKSIIHRSISKGYTSISFERESYLYMSDMSYLQKRKRYNWIKNIFKV